MCEVVAILHSGFPLSAEICTRRDSGQSRTVYDITRLLATEGQCGIKCKHVRDADVEYVTSPA